MEAAVKAFRRLGFRKTSIDDVASEAKVGKGTVYLAARNKDALYCEVVRREMDTWVRDNAKHTQDFSRHGIVRLVYLEVESARQRRLVHPVLTGRIVETVDVDVEALRERGRRNLMTIVEGARAAGRFRPDLDVWAAAELLQAVEIAAISAHPEVEPPGNEPSRPTTDAIERSVDQLIRGFVAA